jgi:hypothetical protein
MEGYKLSTKSRYPYQSIKGLIASALTAAGSFSKSMMSPCLPSPTFPASARRHVSSLPSHALDTTALTSRCKTRFPRFDQTPRSESIRPEDLEAMTKSKCDAFKKVVTPTAPPLHVQKGPDFHHWMSTLGGKHDSPSTESGAHRCCRQTRLSSKTPLARMSDQEAGSLTIHPLQRRRPATPRKPLQRGDEAPAARGSRTAASAPPPPIRQYMGAGRT